jgi:beta-galactosidase/beta-glucuronidase
MWQNKKNNRMWVVNKSLIGLILFILTNLSLDAQKNLKTPWFDKVDTNNVLGEYPRPIMQREQWMNLNGYWQFEEAKAGDKVPTNRKLKEKILVPFPWESQLSGINRQLASNTAWYRRTFTVPKSWGNQKVLLHFGAVDWKAIVYINGRSIGEHKGGYDRFSFEITNYLLANNTNEIIVEVYDPTDTEAIAVGKQNRSRFDDPQRYAYAPASGIWQTVWLEPVPKVSIKDLHITTDIDNPSISVKTTLMGNAPNKSQIKVNVKAAIGTIESSEDLAQNIVTTSIKNPVLWSPSNPHLYDLEIILVDSLGKELDKVKSYAALRKISLKNEKGTQRLALNNHFLFQFGPLDQGFWPDGIYTAPTDEALKWDIEMTKEWGFNMIRKHIKVEPQRWYYWCDKLGILVWQDMPNTFKKRNEEEKIQFEAELHHMITQNWNHPSIVNWIVFNEHWGIYDVDRLTNHVMKLDPHRLVTGNSGIDAGRPNIDYEVGHIKDNHSYRPPSLPLVSDRRATVNGEYGAIGYLVPGHIWDEDGPWVHYNYKGKEDATAEYEKFIGMITDKFLAGGLSGAVYTQWTDVENEMNGFYTYDRKVIKLDKERVTKANKSTWAKDKLTGKPVMGVNE